jgi:hypothetical protein
MSLKARGKIVATGAVITWWTAGEIGTVEAGLATLSIWGDELLYIGIGSAAAHPASWYVAAPVAAAYVASRLYEDPEPIEEFMEDYYQPAVQSIKPDIPANTSEALMSAYYTYVMFKSDKGSMFKKALRYRGANLSF